MGVATEPPPGADRAHRSARNRLIAESVLTETQAPLTRGVVLLGYALLLGADTFQIGLLSTATMLGASLQLGADRLLAALGTRKRVAGVALALQSMVRVLLGMLPLAAMWIAAQHLAWGLLAGLVLVSAAQQVAEVMRLSWVADIVPERERGRFLGDRQFAVQLVGSVVAIAAAWLIDWQRAVSDAMGLLTTQWLLVAAGILGVGSLLVLRSIPEPPPAAAVTSRRWRLMGEPFRDRRFRPLMAHFTFWQIAAPIAGPFFNLYLIEVLDMPLSVVAVYNFVGQVASIYSVRFWGRLADRFGNLPVLRVCVFAKTIFPFMWLLLWTPTTLGERVLVYALAGTVHLWRTFNSGQQLATVNLALKLMPEEQRTSYLATFRTIGNWVHAVSPALAGLLATVLHGAGWSQRWSIGALFVLSGLVRILSYAALRGVREPGAWKARRMLRAIRRIPGVTPRAGLISSLRFWAGPVHAGVELARTRVGRVIATWRGAPLGDDA